MFKLRTGSCVVDTQLKNRKKTASLNNVLRNMLRTVKF